MVGAEMRIWKGRLRERRRVRRLLWHLRGSRRSLKERNDWDGIGIEDVGSGRRFQRAMRVDNLKAGSRMLIRKSRLMLHRRRQV